MKVRLRRHPEVEGRRTIFWHIISGEKEPEASQQIEPQQCVRIR